MCLSLFEAKANMVEHVDLIIGRKAYDFSTVDCTFLCVLTFYFLVTLPKQMPKFFHTIKVNAPYLLNVLNPRGKDDRFVWY